MEMFLLSVATLVMTSLPGILALECYTCESHEWRGEAYGINPEPHSVLVDRKCHTTSLLRMLEPAPVVTCPQYGNFVCVSAHLPYGRNTRLSVRGCYDPDLDTNTEKLCDGNNSECCTEDRCNARLPNSATQWPISETTLFLGLITSMVSVCLL